ncbi:MAG TPA: hypothetical protein VME17_25985 [Bryobacteraceae bacterium]|nr:hypothetical protein [Bryobacteraceae bacterium]
MKTDFRALFLLGLSAVLSVVPALHAQSSSMCPDGSAPLTYLNFHFSGDSYRPGSNCGATSCPDRLVMAGTGTLRGSFCIGQTVTGARVSAQGSFAHYELPPGGIAPGNDIPLAFTGTWKSTGLVSFHLLGLLGTDSEGTYPLAAGVLVMEIVLVRPLTTAIPLTRVPSLLAVVGTLQTWPGVSVPAVPGTPTLPSTFACGAGACGGGTPPIDGVYLIAPDPGGYSFEPIAVESVPIAGGLGSMEAHTPVLFGTLNEDRNLPPPPSTTTSAQ